jgi:hypothetical protein
MPTNRLPTSGTLSHGERGRRSRGHRATRPGVSALDPHPPSPHGHDGIPILIRGHLRRTLVPGASPNSDSGGSAVPASSCDVRHNANRPKCQWRQRKVVTTGKPAWLQCAAENRDAVGLVAVHSTAHDPGAVRSQLLPQLTCRAIRWVEVPHSPTEGGLQKYDIE